MLASCGNEVSGASGSQRLLLRSVAWGRLVEVLDRSGALVREAYVIGEDIISDGVAYELRQNPVTEVASVRILADQGTPEFERLFARLAAGLGTVQVRGASSAPPFSLVPRNAALRLHFSGAIDPATVDATTVQLYAGVPALNPIPVRYRVDPREPELLVLDPTITLYDQVATGLAVNALGLPASIDNASPSITLRLPTEVDPLRAQTRVLLGRGGSPLLRDGNGPTDPAEPATLQRVFRAGNRSDANRGFLLDLTAPRLLGEQQIELLALAGNQIAYVHDVAACSAAPTVGDVIQQGTRAAEIVEVIDATGPDFLVGIRRLDASGEPFAQLQRAQLVTAYDPLIDALACFVRFTPFAADLLTNGVDPNATISLRFSEALDPATASPFDSLLVSRVPTLASVGFRSIALGEVLPAADNRRFTFVPTAPGLAHANGVAESYFLHLRTDPDSPLSLRDLAGNPLDFGDAAILFTLQASASTVNVGGFALRFGTSNEDGLPASPSAPLGGSEWRGQFVERASEGFIAARPVSRFAIAVDGGQPVIAPKPVNVAPERAPLVPLGARLMTVWRYVDLGLGFADEGGYNLDVEGLSWAPAGGQISSDRFPSMEIHLGHSQYLPDEELDATACFGAPPCPPVVFPNSGLKPTSFLGNVLSQTELERVYSGSYEISVLDGFRVPGTDTAMLPWPAFRDESGAPATFTWRDTNIASRGGQDSGGVDLRILDAIFGAGTRVNFYAAGNVPTVGLPLLMDFRVRPDSGATTLGVNGLQVSLANVPILRPSFRVFSAGGFNAQNQAVLVDVQSDLPRGGFGAGGAPTLADDSRLYWGQVDFVIRVSRGVTRWFDTEVADPLGTFPIYLPAQIEPRASAQPPGTRLEIDYRGATAIASNSMQLVHAECLDLYGDPILPVMQPACTTNTAATGITSWSSVLGDSNGRRFLQMRISLVSNIASGAVPTLSSLGIGWQRLP